MRLTAGVPASYVLPLRRLTAGPVDELTAYLEGLGRCLEVIVVDGSPPAVFAEHATAWKGVALRHVPVDESVRALNGKVAGVMTGLRLASHDKVIIADDDVRYDEAGLDRVLELLDEAELVRPQNYFSPMPWHARWDSARSLLNRAFGGDYPGTLAVRRDVVLAAGGYDGDVLFENLELIRTVRAAGGRVVTPLDCFVRRLPPTAAHFRGQRVRQAYDDLAQPHRLIGALAVVPCVVALRRRPDVLVVGAAAAAAVAEAGRRRGRGRTVFPPSTPLFAPAWLLERGVCSWLAVSARLRGGVRYGDTVIPLAANSPRTLQRKIGPLTGGPPPARHEPRFACRLPGTPAAARSRSSAARPTM